MKKIIPALSMLLLAAVMMGTSTFAWFSMNAKVSATGMEITTTVGQNLYIAATTADATNLPGKTEFKTSYITATEAKTILPVSSVNGQTGSYFYTATNNVDPSNGKVVAATYVAYDAADTEDFNTAYNTENAVGYVDYVLCLQANNTNETAISLVMSKANLTYNGAAPVDKAFRVAVLTEKWNGTKYDTLVTTTILAPSEAAYNTANQAVSSTTALGNVTDLKSAATIGTVDAGKIEYYRVTVRLWLEGEDTTCTSATFADLKGTWGLDVDFDLKDEASSVAPVKVLSYGAGTLYTINKGATASAAENDKIVDGITYHEFAATKPDSSKIYATVATVAENTEFFMIDANNHVYNITHLVTVVVPVP